MLRQEPRDERRPEPGGRGVDGGEGHPNIYGVLNTDICILEDRCRMRAQRTRLHLGEQRRGVRREVVELALLPLTHAVLLCSLYLR